MLVFSNICYTDRLPSGASGKELAAIAGDIRDSGSVPVGKIPWRRAWQPTPVFLPGQRSLESCGPWGCKELVTTEAT